MNSKVAPATGRLERLSKEKSELLKLLVEKEKKQMRRIGRDPRRDYTTALPTSWQQQRLWFIDQLEGGTAGYQVPAAVRLRGSLDSESLQKALDALVRRHEILRTTFVDVDGEPRQMVAPDGRFPLKSFDLSGYEQTEMEAQLRRHETEETYGRFELSAGPLARGRLLRLSLEEHVLLVTMHHIIADGWSKGVFLGELSELYGAFREGLPDPLEPLPLQYADYACWQQQWLQDEKLSAQLDYWRAQLHGAAPELDLPTDRSRPPTQSYRGENVQFRLSAGLTAKLTALARRHDVTLFMVLYAALSILLSRLSGQEDIVIGTPVANRQRPELESLIGLFVNTLVLRTCVEGDQPLEAFLQRIKSVTLAAYENQDAPFEQVVKALRPERSLSRNPLFQVAFVLQNAPKSDMRLPDVIASVENVVNEPAILDLVLVLEARGDELDGIANFAKDVFERSTVERWIACLTVLLEEMVNDRSGLIGQLEILPKDERQQVLGLFNDTQATYLLERPIHDLFEEQARKSPNCIAVEHNGRSLTYSELNRQANRLARHLVNRGVGPNRLVGICSERGPDMVIALLGTLKAGGAYVPLDPTYPPERTAYMLQDAAPHVVLAQRDLIETLPASQAEVIVLEEILSTAASNAAVDTDVRQLELSPADLVYVIYTSGSTGRPKGTAMTHRAMVNLIEWHRSTFGAGEQTRVLQFAALSFDVAFQEMLSTLCTGGTLVLLDEWVRRDLGALAGFLDTHRIGRLFLPPLMLQGLAEHYQSNGTAPRYLRDVITAGEQLRITPEVSRLFKRLDGCRLHNHYGPTETHVVTALTLTNDPAQWPTTPPIGRPISNVQIYILDKQRQPVPIGVAGEIYIAGAGVAREYLRQSELTTARFVTDPFCANPAARMYKSGDVGRWRQDGTIEYLGRNDDQVKLRGYRIELGEIEAHLLRQEDVKEAVAVVREDGPGGKQLVAYITSRHGDRVPNAERLRAHMKDILPEHMVPSAFVVIDTLPQTPTGKLDRRALPPPDLGAYVSQHYEAPSGETEEVLARVWRELLQVERIGRLDNFFELGGHSMLGMKLIARLAEQLAIRLPAIAVFRYPTLQRMAAEIDSLRTIEANSMSAYESEMEEGVI